MLRFFDKYQKVFISVFAVLISLSFIFLGLAPKGGSGRGEDPVVFQTTTNQKIKRFKFEGLKALIDSNLGETLVYGKALGPQFFADSFFNAQLIQPGLMKLMVNQLYKEFQPELSEKLKKEKAFTPYTHPSASFISAQTLWSLHAPEIQEKLLALKEEISPRRAYAIKEQLYLLQTAFPSFHLWQALTEQETQFSWLPKDPMLNPERLNLFGYQKPSDWFGETLMKKTVEVIYEINAHAKEQGYEVTSKEAEQELFALNEANFKKLKALGINELESSKEYFEAKLKHLGISRVQMIDLYKEMMLFKRFMNESAHSILLTSLSLDPFEQYADQKIHTTTYALPYELNFSDWDDVLQFESYLMALGKPKNTLSLDFKLKSPQKVAEKYPQLVEQKMKLKFKEVSLAQSALEITVKEIWDYKLNPEHIDILKDRFPKLALETNWRSSQLQDFFEALDSSNKVEVDQFVQQELLKKNVDWLSRSFELTELQEKDFSVRLNGQGLPFRGFEMSPEKENWLTQLFSENKNELENQTFTFDSEHYYQLISCEALSELQFVPYAELKGDQTLDKVLYLTVRDHSSEDLNVEKHLLKAKKEATELLFADLKIAIKNDYFSIHPETNAVLKDNFYVQYRLYAPMRNALAFRQDHAKHTSSLPFGPLWNLVPQERTLVRYLSDIEEMNRFLALKPGHFSSVYVKGNTLEFSELVSISKTSQNHLLQNHLKQSIAHEIKQYVFESTLKNLYSDDSQ